MASQWRHNGGNLDYPLTCYRYAEPRQAWLAINAWHEQSIPYNLIYVPGALYAMPRQLQSQIMHSDWTTGFSWIETGGEIIVQDATAFVELGVSDIEQEMHKLNISTQQS